MNPDEITNLAKELRHVTDMINTGEKIHWGQETELMDRAADMLENHHQQLQKARASERELVMAEINKKDWLREEIEKLEGMQKCEHKWEKKSYFCTKCGVNEDSVSGDTDYNEALQTIIDRYQSELDQLKQ
jgi:hypothetical protein